MTSEQNTSTPQEEGNVESTKKKRDTTKASTQKRVVKPKGVTVQDTTDVTKVSITSSMTDPVEALRQQLEEMKDTVGKLRSDNSLLLKVADKHKLQKQLYADGNLGPAIIRVRLISDEYGQNDGKDRLILAWGRMVKNHVTPKSAYDDDAQRTTVYFHDGTSTEMTYYDFAVTYDQKVELEVVQEARKKGHDGKMHTFYVFNWDGEMYEVEDTFVN